MAAPFRIRPPGGGLAGAGPGGGGDDAKFYLERLVKLVPAEVLSLYLIGRGVLPGGESTPQLAWAGVGLLLVILVRAYTTSDPAANESPQWVAVAVAAVSYVIWLNVSGSIDLASIPSYVGTLAMLVWTFVVPFFYRG